MCGRFGLCNGWHKLHSSSGFLVWRGLTVRSCNGLSRGLPGGGVGRGTCIWGLSSWNRWLWSSILPGWSHHACTWADTSAHIWQTCAPDNACSCNLRTLYPKTPNDWITLGRKRIVYMGTQGYERAVCAPIASLEEVSNVRRQCLWSRVLIELMRSFDWKMNIQILVIQDKQNPLVASSTILVLPMTWRSIHCVHCVLHDQFPTDGHHQKFGHKSGRPPPTPPRFMTKPTFKSRLLVGFIRFMRKPRWSSGVFWFGHAQMSIWTRPDWPKWNTNVRLDKMRRVRWQCRAGECNEEVWKASGERYSVRCDSTTTYPDAASHRCFRSSSHHMDRPDPPTPHAASRFQRCLCWCCIRASLVGLFDHGTIYRVRLSLNTISKLNVYCACWLWDRLVLWLI